MEVKCIYISLHQECTVYGGFVCVHTHMHAHVNSLCNVLDYNIKLYMGF